MLATVQADHLGAAHPPGTSMRRMSAVSGSWMKSRRSQAFSSLRRSSTGTTKMALSCTVGARIGVIGLVSMSPSRTARPCCSDRQRDGGAVLEQMRDEPAQILGRRVERFRAVEEADQYPGGRGVGADGGIAAVLGSQGMRPLAQD
jgi:hypothetical protein